MFSDLYIPMAFAYQAALHILSVQQDDQNAQRSSDAAQFDPYLPWNSKVRGVICTLDDQVLISIPVFSVNSNLNLMFNCFNQQEEYFYLMKQSKSSWKIFICSEF